MSSFTSQELAALLAVKGSWQANAYATPPALSELTQSGYPGSGDPARGNAPTIPGAAWFYMMDMTRLSLIHLAGEVPENPPSIEQYARCLKKVGNFIDDVSLDISKIKKSSIATLEEAISGAEDKIITANILDQYIYQSVAPVGLCQCVIAKEAPRKHMVMDGSRFTHGDAGLLCERLWQFPSTRGDGTSYAVLPNADGLTFQGTIDVSQVCQILEARLPNITGQTGNVVGYNGSNATGVFAITKAGKAELMTGTQICATNISFSAKDGNSIFDGTAVQPRALQALACIRC